MGIANHYKNYLLETENLFRKPSKENITLQTTYLMNDLEPSMFGHNKVIMTRASDVLKIYEELKGAKINSQTIHLLGYSKDGASAGLSRMNFFESSRNYTKLKETLDEDNNLIFYNQDYTFASSLSKRVSDRRDIAKTTARVNLTFTNKTEWRSGFNIKVMNPYQSSLKASHDVKFINKYGAIHIDSLGDTLFSYYKGSIQPRGVTKGYYEEIAAMYDTLSLSRPNSYLWKYISEYKDLSITNMQYTVYTDLVPFIPIIFQGVMPIYTPYLNFNAMGRERLLSMVDFNVYPSYILTSEETFKMRYTPNDYYTTAYADFKDEIIQNYHYLNDALKYITNTNLVKREVVSSGLIANTYENGVIIIINYTSTVKNLYGKTINPLDYEVILP